jgi:uncharacterized membrane protein
LLTTKNRISENAKNGISDSGQQKIHRSSLRISNKNDAQEKEADAVADNVMLTPEQNETDILFSNRPQNRLQLAQENQSELPTLQPEGPEHEEGLLQMPAVQTIGMAGNPDEHHEKEAKVPSVEEKSSRSNPAGIPQENKVDQQAEETEESKQTQFEEKQKASNNARIDGKYQQRSMTEIVGETDFTPRELKGKENEKGILEESTGDKASESFALQMKEAESPKVEEKQESTDELAAEEEIPEDALLTLSSLINTDEEEELAEPLLTSTDNKEQNLSEPEVPAETLLAELSAVIAEKATTTIVNINKGSTRLKNKAFGRASKVKADISTKIIEGVKGVEKLFTAKRKDINRLIDEAEKDLGKRYKETTKKVEEKGIQSKKDIDKLFEGFKTDVNGKVDAYVKKANTYKKEEKESFREEQQNQADESRNKGKRRASIYPNTDRGWEQKYAAKAVAEETAKEIEKRIPKNLKALEEIIEPIPDEFKKQGKEALKGIDDNKPPLYIEIDRIQEGISAEVEKRNAEFQDAIQKFRSQINDQLSTQEDETKQKILNQEQPAIENVDKTLTNIIYRVDTSANRVKASINDTASESVQILEQKKDRKKDSLKKFADGVIHHFSETETVTLTSLTEGVNEQSKAFWQVRNELGKALGSQINHTAEVLPLTVEHVKEYLSKLKDKNKEGYAQILAEFDRIVEDFTDKIKESFKEALEKLENGFKDVFGKAETKVKEAKQKGLSKNSEALSEVSEKMTEAASDAAWRYDHPVLAAIGDVLSFIGGLIVGIILVLAVVVLVIVAFKVIVAGLIALGISALVAKIIVVVAALALMGVMAYKAYSARRAAGQSGWESFWGALGDMTGITDIIHGLTDPNLSPFDRGFFIGRGAATVATFFYGGRLNKGVNRGLIWLSKSARFPRIASFSKFVRAPKITALGTKFRAKLPKFYQKTDALNLRLLKVRESYVRYKANKRLKGKQPGIEKRGYRPKPGERTTTREQWKQRDRFRRIKEKGHGLEKRGTRPKKNTRTTTKEQWKQQYRLERITRKYKEIADYRKKEGITEYDPKKSSSGTVARLETGSEPQYGVNTSLQKSKSFALRKEGFELIRNEFPKAKVWSQVNFITHAEAHSLLKAWKAGLIRDVMVMYVDRPTCNMCIGGLPKLMKALGIKKLIIFSGESKTPITIP